MRDTRPPCPLPILYEDNHVIAIDKPAGLLTQPNGSPASSVEDLIKDYIRNRDHKPGAVFLHAIHRIDQSVSGIVLFAKSQKALSRLSQSMRERACIKEYTALVSGETPPATGPMVEYLRHGDHRAIICPEGDPEARRCELDISAVEAPARGVWRIVIRLVTGRYHQIRAQLASRGLPIIGDRKYGSPYSIGPSRIALHHSKLSFPHPTRNQTIVLSSPVPDWPRAISVS